ncbi:MAG: hypothetical protein JST01_24505 [Cyanobacteria bacterium SZAS TMP-1]|nr:hypothetical protein [Cyanobacteria bacterium SZAS TMP-1]
MKCFQLHKGDIITGLPIVSGSGRPFLQLGRNRAYLSNELLETNPGQRLLHADVEACEKIDDKDAGIRLIPEKNARCSSVLISYYNYGGLIHLASEAVGHTGPDCTIVLAECDSSRYTGYGTRLHSSTTLARLAPGGRIDLRRTWTARAPAAPGWRRFITKRPWVQKTEVVEFLEMAADGTLSVSAHASIS